METSDLTIAELVALRHDVQAELARRITPYTVIGVYTDNLQTWTQLVHGRSVEDACGDAQAAVMTDNQWNPETLGGDVEYMRKYDEIPVLGVIEGHHTVLDPE